MPNSTTDAPCERLLPLSGISANDQRALNGSKDRGLHELYRMMSPTISIVERSRSIFGKGELGTSVTIVRVMSSTPTAFGFRHGLFRGKLSPIQVSEQKLAEFIKARSDA